MKKISLYLISFVLFSCSDKHEVGEYFYEKSNILHIDKKCGGYSKTITSANGVYTGVFKPYNCNSWHIRDGSFSRQIEFCSDCISDEQMRQIEDSIAKYINNHK